MTKEQSSREGGARVRKKKFAEKKLKGTKGTGMRGGRGFEGAQDRFDRWTGGGEDRPLAGKTALAKPGKNTAKCIPERKNLSAIKREFG